MFSILLSFQPLDDKPCTLLTETTAVAGGGGGGGGSATGDPIIRPVFDGRIKILRKSHKGKNRPTYLALALPWASRSTVGTPNLTSRVNKDCSMFENFWNAMFFITGGSW